MSERSYAHRSVADKLGITPLSIVAFDETAWSLDDALRATLQPHPDSMMVDTGGVDVALVTVDERTDAVACLVAWRARIQPVGGIWLLTRKRGQPGYVDQRTLIEAGAGAGLVDNKVCSVSATVSGMRFVVRRKDRGSP